MANYPDWVLKFKKKGTYINFQNGKYYLYAAHSERIKGTNKVRRVSDGYLGRITQEDGLIPPKSKVTGDVFVYEFGRSALLFHLSKSIFNGFERDYPKYHEQLRVACVLSFLFQDFSYSTFSQSYLSIVFSSIHYEDFTPDDKMLYVMERYLLMIQDILHKTFQDEVDTYLQLCSQVFKVKINNQFHTSFMSEELKQKLDNINLEVAYG